MSENKIESVDGFNGHLQQLGNIINYLDGLQMGEVGKFDKGEGQELKNNYIVLNDDQIKLVISGIRNGAMEQGIKTNYQHVQNVKKIIKNKNT